MVVRLRLIERAQYCLLCSWLNADSPTFFMVWILVIVTKPLEQKWRQV